MERLRSILQKCGSAESGIIRYSDCTTINQRLIDTMGFEPKSVCIGIIPYYTPFCDQPRTVSAYALAHDYHKLINIIGENAVSEAKILFPNAQFKYFGDHSPINEKEAAARAGLGIIGAHSLLITPKYSSFVFLFELFTDIEFDTIAAEVKYCENCGRCQKYCPGILSGNGDCVSAITQKKGALSEEEIDKIKVVGSAWGCDICQMVCPHTQTAINNKDIYSESSWFYENVICNPSSDTVEDSDDFKNRAYSWRGKATILRNLDIIAKVTKDN